MTASQAAKLHKTATEALEKLKVYKDTLGDKYYRRKSNPLKRKSKKTASKRKSKTYLRINPAPLLYIITAQGSGKKMHYDGTKFSERAKIRLFKTAEEARICAEKLIANYPMLHKYKICVETNEHKPTRDAPLGKAILRA